MKKVKDIKNSRLKNELKNEIKNEKKLKRKKLHKKILLIMFLILLICIFKFIFDTLKMKDLVENISKFENSVVIDQTGEKIAILGNEQNREKVSLEEVPENLKNAYIAIEDKRYYTHHGVDAKRTGGAIFSYIIHKGSSSFGGSTITQQMVKNISGDDQASVVRKVKEWFRAWEVEICMDKDEILETYFNVIYVGPNVYGVGLGSKYYFNKNISELDLAECAFLAGINNSPKSYNPFTEKDNTEKIRKRTTTVLNQMKEQGYIKDSEYQEAIAKVQAGFNFVKGDINTEGNGIYSYHTDALINQLVKDVSKRKGISETFAKNYIYMSGFKIHSTQDSSIQNVMENECKKEQYIKPSSINPAKTSQSAFVIIDHKTGNVLGCTGGLGEKNTARGLNRATQTLRQTGSAGKPIAVLLPALIDNKITLASLYDDTPTTFDDGDQGYSPIDYNTPLGVISVRRAVESSQNIPFVRIMEEVTPSRSIYIMKKLGVTSLTEVDDNINLALGGLDKGISPLELAGAYATIANDGIYIEPTFYTKVENSENEVIFEVKQETRKVFSKEVAFLLKDVLKQPVEGAKGTATYCKLNNIDVSAKTGTTNENYDRWLCGFTNYYTGVTWYGYDKNETIEFGGKNPAGYMWADVMKKIHEGLPESKFEVPERVTKLAVCKETGKLASFECENTYSEYFIKGREPEVCDGEK